ncbi:hypothetical protein [Paenirhodobacter sp.]|uniref:hypothetical protein n=1 Tax=Paenirhodobacter sp. TaxID=1965326 RepID=UPI003B513DDA
MAHASEFNITTDADAQSAQSLAKAHSPAEQQSRMGSKASTQIASRQEVVWKNGVMTSATSNDKTQGDVTYHATPPTRPGYIAVPGMGEVSVEAAKAGGLIPPHWAEGQPLPFDEPAKGQDNGTEAGTKADADKAPEEVSVAQHRAKVAGEILDAVDTAHGAAVTDALIERAVETGELPLDMLPQGFSAVQMQQVHAGYVASANATLATVGASVPLLEDYLTDAELLQARRATLRGTSGKEELSALGQQAVARLAQFPRTDPEGFAQAVADMPPAERKCITFDNKRGEWMVNIPGKPAMSFGAAVHSGMVRV